MIEQHPAHAALWARMVTLCEHQRLPQALLFVGPHHLNLLAFADRLMTLLLCEDVNNAPCGLCSSCDWMLHGTHPDVMYVRQDTPGSAIKIEQIRGLQHDVYQTPQRGKRRFIVIEPADKMNVSAANALLKILEEPPSHTVFILLAEHLTTLPATVISRCQIYTFPSPPLSLLGADYPSTSSRGQLIAERDLLMANLCELIEEKISPCTLATVWSSYALDDLLWFLYLVTAETIVAHLTPRVEGSAEQVISPRLVALISPVRLFRQLEKINALTFKLHHTMQMNLTLALEDLLLGYLKDYP